VLDAALAIVGMRRPEEARVMRIRNTLCLEELEISEACLAEPTSNGKPQPLAAALPLAFDMAGNLPPL